ncbi:MAG: microcystin degradation protein MlrC [Rhodospirillales bacterium CG15_BIG_FIL_POST_REV_8_21_14_020_66_15]|nr:MAG: microcystin degradation protein MlrC [Rhodospirillales bacterium CG15_BIG_FIL_POST_REV_8_21_14_020_66_15]
MTKRVFIAGFKHETNTFSRLPTDMAAYKARTYYRDDEVATKMRGTATEIGAAVDAARKHGWSIRHPIYANATPSGKVTKDMHDHVTKVIVDSLNADGPFDGILLCLHGAMVCEHDEDGEGRLLQSVRDAVGRDIPVAVTLDLHANVTDRMADLADIMISYRTYPHVDQYEIATQACGLLDRAMKGEIHPKVHVRRREMLDGADHGRTTSPGPMTDALDTLDRLLAETPGTYAGSINAGFPWVDIHDTGPTCVVTGEGDDPAHGRIAERVMEQIWRDRDKLTITLVSIKDALVQVKSALARGVQAPIVLADYADNPGGGGYGDATKLLGAMVEADLSNAAFGTIYDPDAALACRNAGLGATIRLELGGKVDPAVQGGPLSLMGTVTAITDGTFAMEGPMTRGARVDMGPSAVFSVGGVDIVVASRRYQNYDRMFFKSVGIDPEKKKVLGVKSAHHFRAACAPIASHIIVVDDGGGVTSRNYKDLPYRNVRRPVYPLDLD